MKLLSLILLLVAAGFTAAAQNGSKLPPLDKSPMDMSYYPVNYPVLRIQPNKVTEPLVARVIYSRPSKSGRKVFGELVEDGKIWRLGANEATEIEFFRDVKIGGKQVKKGRYTLYALESASKWTLIVTKTPDITESFTMIFEKVTDKSINLIMDWDDVMVKMPISW
jgi:Protein of unknown function (DUF2911)